MTKKIFTPCMLLLILSVPRIHARVKIRRLVTDEQDLPLISAPVIEKGTTNGTVTDANCNFPGVSKQFFIENADEIELTQVMINGQLISDIQNKE